MITFLLWTAGVGCIGFGLVGEWLQNTELLGIVGELINGSARRLRAQWVKR